MKQQNCPMKLPVISLFLSIISLCLHAQSWKVHSIIDTLNYTHSTNLLPVPDYGMRVIASDMIGSDSVYFLNTMTRLVTSSLALINQPTFLQKRIILKSDGLVELNDTATYHFYPGASVGQSWIFNPATQLSAEVVAVQAISLFSIPDSLKTILLGTGDTIQLSKNWGICRFPDFLSPGNYYTLTGIDNHRLGYYLPHKRDFILNNEVSDKFGHRIISYGDSGPGGLSWRTNYYKDYLIVSKVLDSNSVSYTAKRISFSVYYPPNMGEPQTSPITLATVYFSHNFNYSPLYDGYPNEYFFDNNFGYPRYFINKIGIHQATGQVTKYSNCLPFNIFRNDSLIYQSFDPVIGTENPVNLLEHLIIPGIPINIYPKEQGGNTLVYRSLGGFQNKFGSNYSWIGNPSSSEQWPLIKSNDTLNFMVNSNNESATESIWVRAKEYENGDTTFYLNTFIKPLPDNRFLINQAGNFGRSFVKKGNQEYLLNMGDESNQWNKIPFYPSATAGFLWVTDSASENVAYVKSITNVNMFGKPDYIKTFILADGSRLRLSKNWGILEDSLFLNNSSVARLLNPVVYNPDARAPFIHKLADGMEVGDVFRTRSGIKHQDGTGVFKITQAINKQFEVKEKFVTDTLISYVVQGALWEEPYENQMDFLPYLDTLKFDLRTPDEFKFRGLNRMLFRFCPDTITSVFGGRNYIHVVEEYWNDSLQRKGCRLVPWLYGSLDNDTLNFAQPNPGDLVSSRFHHIAGFPLWEYADVKEATTTTPSSMDFHEMVAWATVLDSHGELVAYPSGISDQYEKLQVYPNPFLEGFTVKLEQNRHIDRCELWNSKGAIVLLLEDQESSIFISTQHFPAGVYMLRVYSGSKYHTQKLIKRQ
jgi:hypothetical protein